MSLQLPKKHEEHENHERWLVSYADFITLLFAFFVVMYASSNNNPAKLQQFEDAIRSQMNLDGAAGGIPSFYNQRTPDKSLMKNPPKKNQKKEIEELAGNIGDPALETIKHEMERNKQLEASAEQKRFQKNIDILSEVFKSEIENRQIMLAKKDKDIVILFDNKNAFGAGVSQFRKEFEDTLQKLAKVLDEISGKVRIAGHTDDERLPASSSFHSLLELSSARATRLGAYLIENTRSLEPRLGIESFGFTKPLSNSDSPYKAVTNGRTEIIIYQK